MPTLREIRERLQLELDFLRVFQRIVSSKDEINQAILTPASIRSCKLKTQPASMSNSLSSRLTKNEKDQEWPWVVSKPRLSDCDECEIFAQDGKALNLEDKGTGGSYVASTDNAQVCFDRRFNVDNPERVIPDKEFQVLSFRERLIFDSVVVEAGRVLEKNWYDASSESSENPTVFTTAKDLRCTAKAAALASLSGFKLPDPCGYEISETLKKSLERAIAEREFALSLLLRNRGKLIGIGLLGLVGVALGLALTATGIFAPFGVGLVGFSLMGLLGLGGGTAVGCVTLGGKIVYDERYYYPSQLVKDAVNAVSQTQTELNKVSSGTDSQLTSTSSSSSSYGESASSTTEQSQESMQRDSSTGNDPKPG